MCVFLSQNVCLVVCLSSNCGALLRLLLVPRMMMTASWPSKVFFTSSLFRTSPTTTLDALWSGGSLAGSRTSTVTLYPEEENETSQQQKQMFGKIKLVVCCIYNDMQPHVISGNMYQHNTVVLFPKFTRLLLYIFAGSCYIFHQGHEKWKEKWENDECCWHVTISAGWQPLFSHCHLAVALPYCKHGKISISI